MESENNHITDREALSTVYNAKKNKVLITISLIIHLFTAFSLNSFISSSVFLPALLLYAMSNLSNLLEKQECYSQEKRKTEYFIATIGVVLNTVVVCFCFAKELGVMDIRFPQDEGRYKILIQGILNGFWSFQSLEITGLLFAYVLTLLIIYFLLTVIPGLKRHQYNWLLIRTIILQHPVKTRYIIWTSFFAGFVAAAICWIK